MGDTDEIERKGAIRAAGANFIHSQDGVGGHLGMIALEARKEKIPLMSIHDGYGTLATRALSLLCIARDTFAKKYESEVSLYADILERARSDLPKNVKLPRLPKRGDLELSDVPLSHNMCK